MPTGKNEIVKQIVDFRIEINIVSSDFLSQGSIAARLYWKGKIQFRISTYPKIFYATD